MAAASIAGRLISKLSSMMLPTRVMRSVGYAFGHEIAVGIGRRRPEHVAEHIGRKPVQLLGHAPVARAQARFQMDGGNAELGAGERAGDAWN